MNDHEYLLSNIQNIKGIGKKTSQLFKRKNINTIFDLLWHLPTSKIENSKVTKIFFLILFLRILSVTLVN